MHVLSSDVGHAGTFGSHDVMACTTYFLLDSSIALASSEKLIIRRNNYVPGKDPEANCWTGGASTEYNSLKSKETTFPVIISFRSSTRW